MGANTLVSMLINDTGISCENLIKDNLFSLDVEVILSILLYRLRHIDKLIWEKFDNGCFIVKSANRLVEELLI